MLHDNAQTLALAKNHNVPYVLIDDRYADPGIRRLFPAHWNRMQYTGDAYSLSRILEKFWDE